MPTIDDIMQSFKHKDARLRFAKDVYEKACSQSEILRRRDGIVQRTKPFFPETSVDVLENLLGKLARWYHKQESPAESPFDGWVTVLHCDTDFVLYPKVRAKAKKLYNVYQSILFGKHFMAQVPFDKGNSDDMNVHVSLDHKHLRIVLHNDYFHKEYDSELDHYATGNCFKDIVLDHSSGVVLRRSDGRGRFRFSGRRINLTPEHAYEYIVGVFDNEQKTQYYFDIIEGI